MGQNNKEKVLTAEPERANEEIKEEGKKDAWRRMKGVQQAGSLKGSEERGRKQGKEKVQGSRNGKIKQVGTSKIIITIIIIIIMPELFLLKKSEVIMYG